MKNKEKEDVLQQFGVSMTTESAHSHGLFTYRGKNANAREYIIADYTVEVRRQLKKFIAPGDRGKFLWTLTDGRWCFDFVSADGKDHLLSYMWDKDKESMKLYLDALLINNVQLELATNTNMELELYAELWLLQHLKETAKNEGDAE